MPRVHLQRLHDLGWIECRTVAIEYRWAEGRSSRAAAMFPIFRSNTLEAM